MWRHWDFVQYHESDCGVCGVCGGLHQISGQLSFICEDPWDRFVCTIELLWSSRSYRTLSVWKWSNMASRMLEQDTLSWTHGINDCGKHVLHPWLYPLKRCFKSSIQYWYDGTHSLHTSSKFQATLLFPNYRCFLFQHLELNKLHWVS